MFTKTTSQRSTEIHRNSENIEVCQRGMLNVELLHAMGIERSRCFLYDACTLFMLRNTEIDDCSLEKRCRCHMHALGHKDPPRSIENLCSF